MSRNRLGAEESKDLATGLAGDAERAQAQRHVVGPPDRLVDRLRIEADSRQEHHFGVAGLVKAARQHKQLHQREGEVQHRVDDVQRPEAGRQPEDSARAASHRDLAQVGIIAKASRPPELQASPTSRSRSLARR